MSVDLRELGRELARTDWSWVVAAMVIGLAGVYARAFRWRWLFPPGVEPFVGTTGKLGLFKIIGADTDVWAGTLYWSED